MRISVHAHFWDVFLEGPVSHHCRTFQRKWGQDSNLAIVKCWISFVWSVLLLTDSCVLDHCHVAWPNFFGVSDHKQTLWHSAPDIAWNLLVPQWLQVVRTPRQQNSPTSLYSAHNPSQLQWGSGKSIGSFVFFTFISGILKNSHWKWIMS